MSRKRNKNSGYSDLDSDFVALPTPTPTNAANAATIVLISPPSFPVNIAPIAIAAKDPVTVQQTMVSSLTMQSPLFLLIPIIPLSL